MDDALLSGLLTRLMALSPERNAGRSAGARGVRRVSGRAWRRPALRLCKSLREGAALDAGGTESLYSDIEHYESSTFRRTARNAANKIAGALGGDALGVMRRASRRAPSGTTWAGTASRSTAD